MKPHAHVRRLGASLVLGNAAAWQLLADCTAVFGFIAVWAEGFLCLFPRHLCALLCAALPRILGIQLQVGMVMLCSSEQLVKLTSIS